MGVANFFGSSITTVLLLALSLVSAGAAFCLVMAREVRNAPDMTEPHSVEEELHASQVPASRVKLTIATLCRRLRLNHGTRRKPLARRRARSKVPSTL